jgi:hypothetical protein
VYTQKEFISVEIERLIKGADNFDKKPDMYAELMKERMMNLSGNN